MKHLTKIMLAAAMVGAAAPAVSAREPGDGPRFERLERPERPERPSAGVSRPEKPDRPDTAGERIAKGAAVRAGRAAAGAAIGGTIGEIVTGGAKGTFIGIILSPTRTGCAALHGC